MQAYPNLWIINYSTMKSEQEGNALRVLLQLLIGLLTAHTLRPGRRYPDVGPMFFSNQVSSITTAAKAYSTTVLTSSTLRTRLTKPQLFTSMIIHVPNHRSLDQCAMALDEACIWVLGNPIDPFIVFLTSTRD